MTFRPGTYDDVGAVLRLAQRFAADPPYRGRLAPDPAALVTVIGELLARGYLQIAEDHGAVVGMLGATLYTHPFTQERTATELAWWLEPEVATSLADARRMVLDFEAWADSREAPVRQLIAPAGSRVGLLYARVHREQPYAPLETTWQRRVS